MDPVSSEDTQAQISVGSESLQSIGKPVDTPAAPAPAPATAPADLGA